MSCSTKKSRGPAFGNTKRSNLTVSLHDREGAELKILPESEVKKFVGAFKIKKIQTIEEIIESDSGYFTIRK
jgi:hypothetical protein